MYKTLPKSEKKRGKRRSGVLYESLRDSLKGDYIQVQNESGFILFNYFLYALTGYASQLNLSIEGNRGKGEGNLDVHLFSIRPTLISFNCGQQGQVISIFFDIYFLLNDLKKKTANKKYKCSKNSKVFLYGILMVLSLWYLYMVLTIR